MSLTRNALALLPAFLLMANTSSLVTEKNDHLKSVNTNSTKKHALSDCYSEWNLTAAGLSQTAFDYAVKGYSYLLSKNILNNPGVITIVDYSMPSSQKRLYVLDMTSGKILFNTLVAHGKGSGLEYANDFSNREESHKTSLGFFITQNTYSGENGYSLKLKGCEKGINDKAMERAIVVHGAPYACESFLHNNGYLGRSHGCPAVPEKLSRQIIDAIKNGSCMFLYHPTKKYTAISKILNS